MKAMVLDRTGPLRPGDTPLRLAERPDPIPAEGELLLRVRVCGICHTELDEIEGRTPPSALPRILGHQVVGDVAALGARVAPDWLDAQVGVAWIYRTCGVCAFCRSGRENLCAGFSATGRDVDGGYAERMVVPAAFAHRLPSGLTPEEAAPLLCAGAIGLRSLDLTELADGEPLGLTGFGASGHLVLAMAHSRYPRSPVYVFARSADERALARALGAVWVGDTAEASPEPLAAIIDTTPAWTPIVRALDQLAPGGRLVVNAIRKEDADKSALLEIDYPRHLWREKVIRSAANVARSDVRRCLALAAQYRIRPEVTTYPLEQANEALQALKQGRGRGARVLIVT